MATSKGAAGCGFATGGTPRLATSELGMCNTQNAMPAAASAHTAAVASGKTVLTEGRGHEISNIWRL